MAGGGGSRYTDEAMQFCYWLFVHQLQGELEQVTLTENPDDVRKGRKKKNLKTKILKFTYEKCISLATDQKMFNSQ
jgi:hypothetical protein